MLDDGLGQIRRFDPSFDESSFIETARNLFFRIQRALMSNDMKDVEDIFTVGIADAFRREYDVIRQGGPFRRIESMDLNKLELSEACHEKGMDHVTVIFTGCLIDYTVDEVTGEIVGGDSINPVQFKEYWNLFRNSGSHLWQVSAIYKRKSSPARLTKTDRI